MKIIAHRGLWKDPSHQNSFDAFALSQKNHFGIETDLRSFQGKLVLSHDPVSNLNEIVSLEKLLELWTASPELPLFLNIKEDGLIPLLKNYDSLISNLNIVFFDMSLPQLLKYSEAYPKSMLATRVSEYEQVPLAKQFCSWLWVDSFHQDPKFDSFEKFVVEDQMNLAIVSPELHSRNPLSTWNQLASSSHLDSKSWVLCTDLPHDAKREGL